MSICHFDDYDHAIAGALFTSAAVAGRKTVATHGPVPRLAWLCLYPGWKWRRYAAAMVCWQERAWEDEHVGIAEYAQTSQVSNHYRTLVYDMELDMDY